jgi:hypothetical protein
MYTAFADLKKNRAKTKRKERQKKKAERFDNKQIVSVCYHWLGTLLIGQGV